MFVEPKRGQLRTYPPSKIIVRVGSSYIDPMSGIRTWWCKNILTGVTYHLTTYSIGEQITEMEAIAWASDNRQGS